MLAADATVRPLPESCVNDIAFRGWSLACEPEATGRAQADAGVPGAELCGCLYCLNYAAARPTLHDQATRELLRQLHIPSLRESHVTELGPTRPGYRLYVVLFHFVGEVRTNPQSPTEDLSFRARTYPLPPSFDGLPVVEMSVALDVPWVLTVPEPDAA